MKNFFKMFFFNCMIMGTLITISSYSWFIMWIGLEINLLSIIPLFKSSNNKYPAESTLKYFITQAMASTVILFAVILSFNSWEIFDINYWLILMMNSAFCVKLGAAPFHFWFPEVAEGLNWMNNLMLLTWQKIAPSVILMYNLNSINFLMFIILFSSIIGGIYSFNQTSLRKILAYSSINHIGWMLASMVYFKMNWMIYFTIYSILTFNVLVNFNFFKIYYLNQFMMIFNSNKLVKFFFTFNLLSLGGLPPFLGFFPKWLVVNNLINNNFYILSIILIVFNLVMLFVYMRITLMAFSFNYQENILFVPKFKYNKIMIFNSINLMGLIICSSIFNLF